MTLILALKDKDKIYMASDRALSSGDRVIKMSHPKIHKNGEALIGMAGDSVAIATLETEFKWPDYIPKSVPVQTAVKKFIIPELRSIAKDNDCENSEIEMLVAWRGKIIYINKLVDIIVMKKPCYSIGVFDTAHVVLGLTQGDPRKRLLTTLKACADEMPGSIGSPFDIFELDCEPTKKVKKLNENQEL